MVEAAQSGLLHHYSHQDIVLCHFVDETVKGTEMDQKCENKDVNEHIVKTLERSNFCLEAFCLNECSFMVSVSM